MCGFAVLSSHLIRSIVGGELVLNKCGERRSLQRSMTHAAWVPHVCSNVVTSYDDGLTEVARPDNRAFICCPSM